MPQFVQKLICAALVTMPAGGSAGAAGTLAASVGQHFPALGYPTPDIRHPTPKTQPHPAVARIVVPERRATAYGTGTLVDVRDQYGLVVTNWHVVGDSQGIVEVVFPNGFRSAARPLKMDSDWDLAALVIWRPPIEPVTIALTPPQTGDPLTIHGYGQGQYRIAAGRCTQYYAPRPNYPQEMVELDVEARQGDSGGPIFNHRGELAGVLFGAGQGTTLGSFAPRVSTFLSTLAPDIGHGTNQAPVVIASQDAPNVSQAEYPSSPWRAGDPVDGRQATHAAKQFGLPTGVPSGSPSEWASDERHTTANYSRDATLSWSDVTGHGWYEPIESTLAVVGLIAIALRLVKTVR
jgi:S1-C subfamily serine protease